MKRMKIAVLGTQASGKGTQSQLLSARMRVPPVSVGDLLRDLQNEDSARGRSAKTGMAKGAFVDNGVILPLVEEWVAKHPEGWIMDGFPRSVAQAEASQSFFQPDTVLYLEVPDEASQQRIANRRVCSVCRKNYNLVSQPPRNAENNCDDCGGTLIQRADDTPELVAQRLKNYHEVTEPLKAWYARRGTLVLIDARGSVEDVTARILAQLETL